MFVMFVFQWEEKVEEGQKEFEHISKTIKREVNQYEAKKANEFKTKIVTYLEAIMQLQQEVRKVNFVLTDSFLLFYICS